MWCLEQKLNRQLTRLFSTRLPQPIHLSPCAKVGRAAGWLSFAVDSYEVESCVRRHHFYQCTWTLTDEELQFVKESSNNKDLYTVAVIQQHDIIGHVPRWISGPVCFFFTKEGVQTFFYHNSKALFCQFSPSTLHLVHSWGNHWIVVTTLGCAMGSPKLFGSLYTSTDPSALKHISML